MKTTNDVSGMKVAEVDFANRTVDLTDGYATIRERQGTPLTIDMGPKILELRKGARNHIYATLGDGQIPSFQVVAENEAGVIEEEEPPRDQGVKVAIVDFETETYTHVNRSPSGYTPPTDDELDPYREDLKDKKRIDVLAEVYYRLDQLED